MKRKSWEEPQSEAGSEHRIIEGLEFRIFFIWLENLEKRTILKSLQAKYTARFICCSDFERKYCKYCWAESNQF